MLLNVVQAIIGMAILLGLPLLGAWWAGKPIAEYLQFPPQPVPTTAAPFSRPLFVGCLLLEIPLYLWSGWVLLRSWRFGPHPNRVEFPRWGLIAVAWLGIAWYLAWARPKWLGPLADFTFTPLWLGYIGVVNALCQWRTGHCLLTSNPRFLVWLFPLSALFWWYFEYLNRFVGNWHYLGVEHLTAWQYFWRATLPFSTVLPAVVSTIALLCTWFGPAEGLSPLRLSHPRRLAVSSLILGCIGLIGVGRWPQWFFPLLWLAPLILFVAIQVLMGARSYFYPLRQGRWEVVALPMLAGLICGFFWELWNYWSDPKWVYSVPYVSRFKLFEMPVLGYAGYLPFGLECAVVADWWARLTGYPHAYPPAIGIAARAQDHSTRFG